MVVEGSNFQCSARLPAFCGERLWPIGGSRCINTDRSRCACARAIQTGTGVGLRGGLGPARQDHGAQEGSPPARDGAGPLLTDVYTGEIFKTWFFVMTLCGSRQQHAEFVRDQTVATWLNCHRRALLSTTPSAPSPTRALLRAGRSTRLRRMCRRLWF